ncbi:MAG: hypothetical protein ACI808_001048, partial [Paraglaciecola sp.]
EVIRDSALVICLFIDIVITMGMKDLEHYRESM